MKAENLLTERDKQVFVQSGFGKKIELGKRPIFLIIDATYEYVGPEREPILESIKKSYTACGLEGYLAVDSIQRMLPFVRASNIPIVYTVIDRTKKFPFDKKRARAGESQAKHPEWAAVVKEIEPLSGDTVIAKLSSSAYFGTDLLLVHLAHNIDTVIVVGGTTSGCVRATANDAAGYGYKVAVIEDAVFDRFQASHVMSLFDMGAKWADIITEQQAIEYFQTLK